MPAADGRLLNVERLLQHLRAERKIAGEHGVASHRGIRARRGRVGFSINALVDMHGLDKLFLSGDEHIHGLKQRAQQQMRGGHIRVRGPERAHALLNDRLQQLAGDGILAQRLLRPGAQRQNFEPQRFEAAGHGNKISLIQIIGRHAGLVRENESERGFHQRPGQRGALLGRVAVQHIRGALQGFESGREIAALDIQRTHAQPCQALRQLVGRAAAHLKRQQEVGLRLAVPPGLDVPHAGAGHALARVRARG
jgi:hypothetical protein